MCENIGESQLHAHRTRSGASFSPWADRIGMPIAVDFDIAPFAQAAAERAMTALVDDSEDEDDLPVTDAQSPRHQIRQSAQPIGPENKVKDNRDKFRSKLRRRSVRLVQYEKAYAADAMGRHTKSIATRRRKGAAGMPVKIDVKDTPQSKPPPPSRAGFFTQPVASSGFVGRRLKQLPQDRVDMGKEDAMALGFSLVEWNGRDPHALVDKSGRVIAVLVGQPRDTDGWAKLNDGVQKVLEDARAKCEVKNPSHRRGEYSSLATGISYGGGQRRVSNLSQTAQNEDIVQGLLKNPLIKRLAGFGNAAFKLFAPRLYEYYGDTMATLLKHDPELQPNFKKSVFGAATFNLGPRVFTYVHTDHLNLPAGWCAITALGQFDPKNGGHLLLWDLKFMIEFPPGALILLPSAILHHSNTIVGPAERRYSFTQYSAGGLFRWVECGFKSQKDFLAEGGSYAITGTERWLRGVQMWNTWDELQGTESD